MKKRTNPQSRHHRQRALKLEPLEPRILFSGSPAPAADGAAQQEAAEQEVVMVQTEAPVSAGQEDFDVNAQTAAEAAQTELEGVNSADNVSATLSPTGEQMTVLAPELEQSEVEDESLVDVIMSGPEGLEQINPLIEEAAERWRETGLSAEQEEALGNVTYRIADLSGFVVANYENGVITIDDDASGVGWFVDETPEDDSEFSTLISGTALGSTADEIAQRMDLLTIIMHEQGHVLGLDDIYDLSQPDDIMYGGPDLGVRRLAEAGQADGAQPGAVTSANASIVAGQTADVVNGDTSSIANLIASDGGDGISLREAIIAANNTAGQDTITLGAGTYDLTIMGSNEGAAATGDLDITDDLILQGNGSGSTIIDGGGTGVLNDRIFEIHGDTVTLEGLTITGGFIDYSHGGGIYSNNGDLTLNDVLITDNVAQTNNADRHGGGAWFRSGSVQGTDVDITFNSAQRGTANNAVGGGFWANDGADVDFTNVTITNNSAREGGGFYVSHDASQTDLTQTGSTIILNNANVDDNFAVVRGGGFRLVGQGDGSSVTVNSGTISRNTADEEHGGGFYNQGTVNLTDVVVDGNMTFDRNNETGGDGRQDDGWGAGFINNFEGVVTITGNSSITNNEAFGHGGGFWNRGGQVTITGSAANVIEIEGNAVFRDRIGTTGDNRGGGGFFNSDEGVVTISDALITANETKRSDNNASDGYGAGFLGSSGSTTNLTDVEISGNILTDQGAGFYQDGVHTRVIGTNVTIQDNEARVRGGGFRNATTNEGRSGFTQLTDSSILRNEVQNEHGGGFYANGTVRLINTDVQDNKTFDLDATNVNVNGGISPARDGHGAGFFVTGGHVIVSGGTISGNDAFGHGGGFHNTGGIVDVTGTMIDSNQVLRDNAIATNTNSGQVLREGGGFWNDGDGVVNLDSVAITNNVLPEDSDGNRRGTGAGFGNANGSEVHITGDSVISGNLAEEGGGFYNTSNGSIVTITGTAANPIEIQNNEARVRGGGFRSTGGTETELSYVTFDQNVTLTERGGGIYNDGGIITGDNIIISNHNNNNGGGNRQGGGIWNSSNGQITLEDSEITGNASNHDGGGVYVDSGILNLEDTTISGNYTERSGAGLFLNNSAQVNLTDTIISGNTAHNHGGGFWAENDSVTVGERVTISENLAGYEQDRMTLSDANRHGGGFFMVNAAQVTLIDSTVDANEAREHGGAAQVQNEAQLTLIATTISNNISGNHGGGFRLVNDAKLDAINSTISGNLAGYQKASNGGVLIVDENNRVGGGIWSQSSGNETRLNHVTITDNKVTGGEGAGVQRNNGFVEITNSIVFGNIGDFDNAMTADDLRGDITLVGANVVGQHQSGTLSGDLGMRITTDPGLGVLQDNGGPTHTHAIASTSSAASAAVGSSVAEDQRGEGRLASTTEVTTNVLDVDGVDLLGNAAVTDGDRPSSTTGNSVRFGDGVDGDTYFTAELFAAGTVASDLIAVTVTLDYTRVEGDLDPQFVLTDGVNEVFVTLSDAPPPVVNLSGGSNLLTGTMPAVNGASTLVLTYMVASGGATVTASEGGQSGRSSNSTGLDIANGLSFIARTASAFSAGEDLQVDHLQIDYTVSTSSDLGAFEVDPLGTAVAIDTVTVPENVISGNQVSVSAEATADNAVTYDWEVRDGANNVVATGTGADFDFTPTTPDTDPIQIFTVEVTVTDSVTGQTTFESEDLRVLNAMAMPDSGTAGIVGVITVTTGDDVVDGDTSSLANLAGGGTDGLISLREAIQAANNESTDGIVVIEFDPSVTTATMGTTVGAVSNEDAAANGDFDITRTNGLVSIVGNGTTTTTIDGAGLDRVFNIRRGATAFISELTITGGDTTNSGDHGGGIENLGGITVLKNVNIDNNTATQSIDNVGGGVYTSSTNDNAGVFVMTGGRIMGNAANSHGGGLYGSGNNAGESFIYLNDVELEGNDASNSASRNDRDGGGFYFTGTGNRVVFNDVDVDDNQTQGTGGADGGGGLFTGTSNTYTLTGGSISRNIAGSDANNSDNDGGGFMVEGGFNTITLTNVLFGGDLAGGSGAAGVGTARVNGNFAEDDGGAFFMQGRGNTVNLVDTEIFGNQSDDRGGAFYLANRTETVNITGSSSIRNNFSRTEHAGGFYTQGTVNVTGTDAAPIQIRWNEARSNGGLGGGFYVDGDGTANLVDVQIDDNIAGSTGGGFRNSGGGTVTISSSNSAVFRSSISNNESRTTDGGGFYQNTAFSTTNLTDIIIDGNTAGDDGGGFTTTTNYSRVNLDTVDITNNTSNDIGGGILSDANGSEIVATNINVSDNVGGNHGGGIYNWGSFVATGITVDNNDGGSTDNADRRGGGIYNDVGILTLTDAAITNNVTAQRGGGIFNSGGGVVTIDSSDPDNFRSVISGNTLVRNNGSDGAGFFQWSASSRTILTDVDIRNNINPIDNGGGFYVESDGGHVELYNVIIDGNTARDEGGGFMNASGYSTVHMENVQITNNSTELVHGGGIRNLGQITGSDVKISNNTAGTTDQAANNNSNNVGGGIHTSGTSSSVVLERVEISDNDAHGRGGGVYVTNGTLEFTDFIVARNTTDQGTNEGQGRGGGFWISSSADVKVSRGEISENESYGHGAGVYMQDTGSTFDATNVTISSNIAGIDQTDGSFVGERVGGGVWKQSTTGLFLTHVTVTANQTTRNAADAGSGVRINGGGRAVITNSIIFGNLRDVDNTPDNDDLDNDSGTVLQLVGSNIIGRSTGTVTGNISNTDPNLGALQDNGGFGRSHLPGLPAIDQAVGSTQTVDQRGAARPLGAAADLGAIETRVTEPVDDSFTITEDDASTDLNLTENDRVLIADYRDDFGQATTMGDTADFRDASGYGWQYLWNAPVDWDGTTSTDASTGAIGDSSTYQLLKADQDNATRYSPDGDNVTTNGDPGRFLFLTSGGGHPGNGFNQTNPGGTNASDRYAIAAYTVSEAGDYEIFDAFIRNTNPGGSNGGILKIFVNDTEVFSNAYPDFPGGDPSAVTLDFGTVLSGLSAGDTIYVAAGANGNNGSDGFAWDFSIGAKPTVTAVTQPSDATVTGNMDGSTVNIATNGQFDHLAEGESTTQTFQYSVEDDTIGEDRPVTFIEKDGIVVGDATQFAERGSAAAGGTWVERDEATDNPDALVGSRTGDFLQIPDVSGTSGTAPDRDPFVDYKIQINNTGTYDLFLRSTGFDGGSDSLYAAILELQDDAGPNPEFYAHQIGGGGATDTGIFTWRGGGTVDDPNAPSNNGTMAFDLVAGTTYTLRIMPREDGAAIDAFALIQQGSGNAVPTGTDAGPAASESLTGLLATATVTVNGVNDAAAVTAAATDQMANEATVSLTDVVSFTDKDLSDTHTVTIDWGDGSGPQALTVDQDFMGLANLNDPLAPTENEFSADAMHTYADQGIFNVTVTIDDGNTGGIVMHTFELTVNNVSATATADTINTTENTAIDTPIATLLANDAATEPNTAGDNINLISVTPPSNGVLSLVDNGSGPELRYTPNFGFSGVDTFTYTIDDGEGSVLTQTGSVNVIAGDNPPADLGDGVLTEDDAAQLIVERQNVKLVTDLTIDSNASPTSVTYTQATDPGDGVIAAGTVVNSHLLHFDPATADGTVSGSITFDSVILGIIWEDGNLDTSDGITGSTSTTYPTATAGRGALDEAVGDSLTISADGMTIDFSLLSAGAIMDQIRIITAVNPAETATVTINVAATDDAPMGGVTVTTDESSPVTVNVIDPEFIEQQLLTPDVFNIFDQNRIGEGLSIDGDIAVIGANQTGARENIYVLRNDVTNGWQIEQTISAPDGFESADDFGTSVEVDAQANQIIVGARLDDQGGSDRGRVYVYDFDPVVNQWFISQQLGNGLPGLDGGDSFGVAVDVHNDGAGTRTMVIGAHQQDTGGGNRGSAYVFSFNDATGQWDFVQQLQASDAANSDGFGESVAVDGDTIVAGAEDEDTGGSSSGSVYVFTAGAVATVDQGNDTGIRFETARDGVGNVTVEYVDPAAANAAFSFNVVGDVVTVNLATDGAGVVTTTAADIAAALNDQALASGILKATLTGTGADAVASTGGAQNFAEEWSERQILRNPSPNANDRLGFSVDVSGGTVVSGARQDDTGGSNRGLTHVFVRSEGVAGDVTDDTWTLEQSIQPNDIGNGDQSGVSVAIEGDTLLIGSFADNAGGEGDRGAAYIFTRTAGVWTQQQKLIPADENDFDDSENFGRFVALSDNGNGGFHYLIGGNSADEVLADGTKAFQVGQAYVFEDSAAPGTAVSEFIFEVPASDLLDIDSDAEMGREVAISADGNIAVVGAPLSGTNVVTNNNSRVGAAYVYQRNQNDLGDLNDDTWTLLQVLQPSNPSNDDRFGQDVDISADGTTIIAGAFQEDTGGSNRGSVYVYELSGGTFSQVARLNHVDDGGNGDNLGFNIAINEDGSIVTAGARLDNNALNNDEGSLFIFHRDPANGWSNGTEDFKLEGSVPGVDNEFSRSHAISGNRIVSASRLDDDTPNNSGSVDVYEFDGTSWRHIQQIFASDAQNNDQFGVSVSMFGALLVVGSEFEDTGGGNSGAAYVFRYDSSLNNGVGGYVEEQILKASNAGGDDRFGFDVAVYGERILVGARQEDTGGSNRGSAYLFEFDGTQAAGSQWMETQVLQYGDYEDPNESREFVDNGSGFGISVDLGATTALVGASNLNRVIDFNNTPDDPNDDLILRNHGGAVPFQLGPKDGDGSTTFTLVSADTTTSGGGIVAIDTGTGEITFDPGTDFEFLGAGEETVVTFNYVISDGTQQSTVTGEITVTGQNDAPVANPDTGANFTVSDGDTIDIPVADFFANDTDPDTSDTQSLGGVDFTNIVDGAATVDLVAAGEVGTLNNVTHVVQTVTFSQAFVNPVVIAQSPTFNESDPAVVRISNVTATSFDIQIVEPTRIDRTIGDGDNPVDNDPIGPGSLLNNGTHIAETVSFIVMEAGTHVLENGTRIEVGTIVTDNTVDDGYITQEFSADFVGTPAIMTQIQTLNSLTVNSVNPGNGTPSLFMKTRTRNTSDSSFQVAHEFESRFTGDLPEAETIGYIAIEQSFGTFDRTSGLSYQAGRTADNVNQNFVNASFETGLFTTAPALVTTMSKVDGGDDAQLRVQNITNTGFQVRSEEDTSVDEEIAHSAEVADFIAIEGAGILNVIDPNGFVRYDTQGAFGALAQGETVTESFDYIVRDSSGVESMSTVTITIQGVNDPTVVTAAAATDINENEATTLTVSYTDVDATDTHTVVVDWDDPNDVRNETFDIPASNSIAVNDTVTGSLGNTLTITAADVPNGQFTFTVDRTYLDDGLAGSPFDQGQNATDSDQKNITVDVLDAFVPEEVLGQFTFPIENTATEDGPAFAPTTTGTGVTVSPIADTSGNITITSEQLSYANPVLQIQPGNGSTNINEAVAGDRFFEFTVTPDANKMLALESLTFAAARGGGTTPRGWGLASSVDGFTSIVDTQDIPTIRNNLTDFTVDLTDAAFQNLTEAVTFRVYVYSPASGSTMEFDDFSLNGAVRDTNTATMTVSNVAPSNLTADVNAMINEGETATLTGGFTDQGLLDSHEVVVDWGDPNDAENSTFNLEAIFSIDPTTGLQTQELEVGDTFTSTTDTAVLEITAVNTTTGEITYTVTHQYLDDGASTADFPGSNGTSDDSYTVTMTVVDDDAPVAGGYAPLLLNDPDLTGYWRFEDGVGSLVAVDSSTNGNDATANNGPVFGGGSAEAALGEAVTLDGTDDFFSTGATSDELGFTGDFTASAWINLGTTNGDNTIFGNTSGGSNQGLHLVIRNQNPHFGFFGNDTTAFGTSLNANEWYHVTWRYSAANNNEQALYVNGNQVARAENKDAFNGGSKEVVLGRWNTGGNYFDGQMDEVSVIGRSMSDADILALYQSGPVFPSTASDSIQVKNVEATPTVNAVTAINENGTAVLTGSVTDPGTLDSQQITVDWGDPNDLKKASFEIPAVNVVNAANGATTQNLFVGNTFNSTTEDSVLEITSVDLVNGIYEFEVRHQYLDDGISASPFNSGENGTPSDTATITVTVVDDDMPSYESLILAEDNLNAYWKLDEATGALVAVDASGNGITGSVNGPVSGDPTADPALGTAYTFDGVDDVINTDTGAQELGFGGSFTASAWVNLPDLSTPATGTNDNTIFGAGSGGARSALHLIIRDDKVHMGFFSADTPGTTSLTENTWHHVTWSYDAVEMTQKVYLDGQLDGFSIGNRDAFIGTADVTLGQWRAGTNFEGSMDELSIIGRTLSDAEVAALAAAGPSAGMSASTTVTINNVAPEDTANAAGEITLNLTSVTIDENNTATLNGSFIDQGRLDSHEVVIDWDDDNDTANATFSLNALQTIDPATGTVSALLAVGNSFNSASDNSVLTITGVDTGTGTVSFTVDHLYSDDGLAGTPANGTASDLSTIMVTVTDDDTGVATESIDLTVNNVAPTLVLSAPMEIQENNTVTLTGTYTDQGTLDQQTFVIDWDDDNDTANATFVISPVQMVNTANGGLSSLLAVNDTFGSSTDDSVLTITGINVNTGAVSFSVTHLYQDDGDSGMANGTTNDVSTISVNVTDDDTGTITETIDVTVNNSAPTLTLDAVTPILEDEIATFTGTYTDTGFLDQQVLVIDWDDHRDPDDATFTIPAISQVTDKTDGTTGDLLMVGDTIMSSTDEAILTITDINRMTGEVSFSVEHLYTDDGSPVVSFTVTDDDTGAVTETVNVTVGVIRTQLEGVSPDVFVNPVGGGPINLFPNVRVIDNPSELFTSAVINFANGYVEGEDILSLAIPPGSGFTADFDPATGALTITAPAGGATIAQLQQALRGVFYTNINTTDPTAGLRVIGITVIEDTDQSDLRVVSVIQRGVTPVVEVPPVFVPEDGEGAAGDGEDGAGEGDGGLDLTGISNFLRDLSEGEIFFGTDPLEVQRLVEEAGLGTRTSPVGGLPGNGFFGGTPGTGSESTVLTEFSTVIGGRTVPGAEVTITLSDGLGGQSLTQSMLVDDTGQWLFNYGGLQLQDRPYLLRVEIEMPDPFNPGEFITVISHYILTGDMLMGPSGEKMITEGLYGIAVVKLENQ